MVASATGPTVTWPRPDPVQFQTPVASTGTAAARARPRISSIRVPSTASEVVMSSTET